MDLVYLLLAWSLFPVALAIILYGAYHQYKGHAIQAVTSAVIAGVLILGWMVVVVLEFGADTGGFALVAPVSGWLLLSPFWLPEWMRGKGLLDTPPTPPDRRRARPRKRKDHAITDSSGDAAYFDSHFRTIYGYGPSYSTVSDARKYRVWTVEEMGREEARHRDSDTGEGADDRE